MSTQVPHVVGAKFFRDRILVVEFSDGVSKEVDFAPYIERGGVFAPLERSSYFKRFFLDLNTVCWPNGADVAPERLYEIGLTTRKRSVA